eukprot:10759175-Alexandrium_andersonii.AAC.1
MSASLVGSEMCIRDRRFSPLALPLLVAPQAASSIAREAAAAFRQLTLPPVSYTHLTLPTICSV